MSSEKLNSICDLLYRDNWSNEAIDKIYSFNNISREQKNDVKQHVFECLLTYKKYKSIDMITIKKMFLIICRNIRNDKNSYFHRNVLHKSDMCISDNYEVYDEVCVDDGGRLYSFQEFLLCLPEPYSTYYKVYLLKIESKETIRDFANNNNLTYSRVKRYLYKLKIYIKENYGDIY
jgi:hypothetical protein